MVGSPYYLMFIVLIVILDMLVSRPDFSFWLYPDSFVLLLGTTNSFYLLSKFE